MPQESCFEWLFLKNQQNTCKKHKLLRILEKISGPRRDLKGAQTPLPVWTPHHAKTTPAQNTDPLPRSVGPSNDIDGNSCCHSECQAQRLNTDQSGSQVHNTTHPIPSHHIPPQQTFAHTTAMCHCRSPSGCPPLGPSIHFCPQTKPHLWENPPRRRHASPLSGGSRQNQNQSLRTPTPHLWGVGPCSR